MADEPLAADELTVVFARMAGLLLSPQAVQAALSSLTVLAADTLTGSVGAGVSLLDDDGKRLTAAATDAVVQEADQAQYDLGEGPCLTAWARRQTVRVDDLRTDSRWPRWRVAVAASGLRAAVSAPLRSGDRCLGALKVYADVPGAYDHAAERRLGLLAEQAAVLLAHAHTEQVGRELSETLRSALQARDVLAQAKGVLIGQERTDEETAFAMLLAAARAQQRPLHEVAQSVLDGVARKLR